MPGMGYDLRSCEGCGMLYDHDHADWNETRCTRCVDT